MGLRMAQGRALTDEADRRNRHQRDRREDVGRTEPLDETINFQGQRRVVGVIEDFHFHGPRTAR